MDETEAQMTVFLQTLQAFNANLQASVSDMSRHHQQVSPLWQDSFRRQYDAEWQHFVDLMDRYINRDSLAYEQYLFEKLAAIRGYLYGN